jgi:hypothetical protein
MRARLKGMTIARKALSDRALPAVENILPVLPRLGRMLGKKCCRMPTSDAMPDERSKVYMALNICALWRSFWATIKKKSIQHINVSSPAFLK